MTAPGRAQPSWFGPTPLRPSAPEEGRQRTGIAQQHPRIELPTVEPGRRSALGILLLEGILPGEDPRLVATLVHTRHVAGTGQADLSAEVQKVGAREPARSSAG